MSNGSSGGIGGILQLIGVILLIAIIVQSCSNSGGSHYHGTKGNPYQAGTTNHERYERLFG